MDILLCISGFAVGCIVGSIVVSSKMKKRITVLERELSFIKRENGELKTKQRVHTGQEVPPKTPIVESKSPHPIPKQVQGAKESFIANLHFFKPYLNTLIDGTYNCDDWTKVIHNISNGELSCYWEKVYRNTDSILRMLAMWGIRPETCIDFIGVEPYKEMYQTITGDLIEIGQRYKVESPCWITTDNYTGKKQVLLKGIVRAI